MSIKNKTTKAIKQLQEPSGEKLNTYERVGVASGGALLAFLGLKNMRRGWPLALLGGALAASGIAGKNPLYFVNSRSKKHLKVKTSIVINKEADEVYNFWRKLENLPTFMKHIKEISTINNKQSHWKADLNGVELEWDAEITADVRGERIGWRSLPGSEVQTSGQVDFKRAPGNGTELKVVLEYADDAGKIAKAIASAYHDVFRDQVREDLEQCKKTLETRKAPETAKTQTPAHG